MQKLVITFLVLSFFLHSTVQGLQRSVGTELGWANASNASNATHHEDGHFAAPWETCDFEAAHYPYVWLVLYILLVLFLFLGLAIICDDFFVPSLEAITDLLNLSEDVAGATFMAAGSSAPELFTSVAGVGVNSDVGVGTIVGSAMFNILIIVALSAVLAGKTLYLDWKPLCRDAFVYGISIVLLIGFTWDGKVEWYEVTVLLLLYAAYILLMKFNSFVMSLLDQLTCRFCRHSSAVSPEEGRGEDPVVQEEPAGGGAKEEPGGQMPTGGGLGSHKFVHSHRGELTALAAGRRRSTMPDHLHAAVLAQIATVHSRREWHVHGHFQPIAEECGDAPPPSPAPTSSTQGQQEQEEEEAELPKLRLLPLLPAVVAAPPDPETIKLRCGVLRLIVKWHLFIVSFPYMVAFTWTIPNCSSNRKWYRVAGAFLASVLWIAVLSFAMVTLVAKVGCILDIDSFVMGLVVIAVGTSIPDAMSSILVARDGFGDMAISNAIGSNVFDINLGLGLPFLIRIIIDQGQAFSLLSPSQQALYDAGAYSILPHPKFGILLLVVVLAVLLMLLALRFRLNKVTGLLLGVTYALFLAYAFTQELACAQGLHC